MAVFWRVVCVTWFFSATSTQDLAHDCETVGGTQVCYTVPDLSLAWEDAFQYCGNLSAGLSSGVDSVLARVYTPEHQTRLEEFLSNNNITSPVWISARTEDPEDLDGNPVSQWRWVYECERCDQEERREMLRMYALNQQGCYADNDANPDLTKQISGSGWGAELCQEACNSDLDGPFLYSGLQGGSPTVTECWCGDQFGVYGPISDCVKDCGDYNCGGSIKNFIYRYDGMFGHWGYQQPDNNDGDFLGQPTHCAAPRLKDSAGAVKYRYFDINCQQKFPFICRYNSTELCTSKPHGGFYEIFNDTCVYQSDLAGAITWYNARQFCRDGGGDLITFNSYSEHEAVLAFAAGNTVDLNNNQLVYIGVYRNPLLWKRVHQDAEMSYYNLGPGEPQAGDCMVLDPGDGYKWKMADCGNQRNFLCFEGPTDDPAPTTTAAATTTRDTTENPSKPTVTQPATPTPTPNPPDVTGSTSSVVTPEGPDGPGSSSGDEGGLSRTEKILIGVLTSVGGILIIILIVFLVCRKKKRDETGRVAPLPKEKVDARLQASRPHSGPLWDVNEGYHDMGSTANLMFAVKQMIIPKWKKNASIKKTETEEVKEDNPDMLRRRKSDTESILVPDLLQPLESSPNGAPPVGRYGYTGSGPPSVTMYESPQNSRTALIRSYGSMPGWSESIERSRTTLPGAVDYQSSLHGSERTISELREDNIPAPGGSSKTGDETTESIPEEIEIESAALSSNSERMKSVSVLDDPLGAGKLMQDPDIASLNHVHSDPETSSIEENSPRGSDAPLVRKKSRDHRTPIEDV